MDKLNPDVTLYAVAAEDTVALTIVVLASTVGAAPFAPVNTGEFGLVALNSKYCFAVAPELGKVAALQATSTCVLETPVAVNDDACAVGGLDKVRKLLSVLKPA